MKVRLAIAAFLMLAAAALAQDGQQRALSHAVVSPNTAAEDDCNLLPIRESLGSDPKIR
jgi:hypothetical protein